jgi:fructokinase
MSSTIVAFGEILWDLLPSGAVLGGAPFNFVYRVDSLGHRGVMVSRLGRDDLGDRALRIVENLELETGCLQRDHERPTGTVEVTFDEERNPRYRIIPEVAYDFIEYSEGLRRLAAGADCLCFGTLIQRREVSRTTLYRLLEEFSGRFVLLDINLRPDCYTRRTILDSIGRANILKLNDGEAEHLVQIYALPRGSVAKEPGVFADTLFARTDLQYIVLTLGERGAFAASRDGQMVYHPAFSVKLRDPVGAGDAFTAGFLDALLNQQSLAEACRFASAAGALVAAQEGATQPLQRAQIETFLQSAETRAVEEEYRRYLVS